MMRPLQETRHELGDVLPGVVRSRPGLRRPADQSPGGVRRELLTFGGIDADFRRVSEEGVEVDGKEIPLTRENRKQVLAAVERYAGRRSRR